MVNQGPKDPWGTQDLTESKDMRALLAERGSQVQLENLG